MSKKKEVELPVSEWSYWVEAEEVQDKPVSFDLSPNEEEAKALAKRLSLLSLDSLSAHVSLSRQGQIIHAKGRFQADITQECVVSMEPVKAHIEEEFDGWFADPDQAVSIAKARRERESKKGHGELPILEERDDPEAIVDGKVDIGELVTQYLSLSIDPYPHAEGVASEYLAEAKKSGDVPEVRKNPFAVLKDWKDKLK